MLKRMSCTSNHHTICRLRVCSYSLGLSCFFCVGIPIFGTGFCVGIYDRDGVTFPPSSTCSKTRRLLFALCGHCNTAFRSKYLATVHVLTDLETQKLTGNTNYPSAVVVSLASRGNNPVAHYRSSNLGASFTVGPWYQRLACSRVCCE